MLEIKNLCCGYDKKNIINNFNIKLKRGQNISILGPNGCGKSTLLKSIIGLLDYEGEIYLDNCNMKKLKRDEVAKKISYMPQVNNVYFPYTVFETVMLGRYSKVKRSFLLTYSKNDIDFVNECINRVGIYNLKDKNITCLSGGELQRVFLAKIFAQDSDIILLDEPSNHLDLKYQIELMEYLKQWLNKNRIVISILHDINLAMSFSEKLLLLSEGKKVAFGNKKDILNGNYFNEIYNVDIKTYMKNSYTQWDF